jgi:hypothetical protein
VEDEDSGGEDFGDEMDKVSAVDGDDSEVDRVCLFFFFFRSSRRHVQYSNSLFLPPQLDIAQSRPKAKSTKKPSSSKAKAPAKAEKPVSSSKSKAKPSSKSAANGKKPSSSRGRKVKKVESEEENEE